ncbi:neurogenic locus protein delta isoform X1 [Ixodes scapularis]|uniref:neurogenic locus protein delta isoform X1 n=1 Tax=Ixodes scapularis TaxID=6945 RepID=UPI001A9CCF55|nr:neurogenic locus protein delta isoform X1 [Ixodes scapularis]
MIPLMLIICTVGVVNVSGSSDLPPQVPQAQLEDKSTDLNEEDRCLTDFKDEAEIFEGKLECQKDSENGYKLACVGQYREYMSYKKGDLTIEICELKECQEYCTEEGEECLENECVCKKSHFVSEGSKCIPYCIKKDPCQNGGKCTLSEKTPFHCRCKPGFKGPLCELEDVIMATTIRNTVVVGVVFGILIVLCLAVAIVIIQRLKNKIAMHENANEVLVLVPTYNTSASKCFDLVPNETKTARDKD